MDSLPPQSFHAGDSIKSQSAIPGGSTDHGNTGPSRTSTVTSNYSSRDPATHAAARESGDTGRGPSSIKQEPIIESPPSNPSQMRSEPLGDAMNTAFERSQTRRNDFTEEQIAQITASVLQQMQHMSAPGPEMSARNLHDTGSSTQASPAVDRKSSEAAEQPQRINRGGLQDEVVISQTFIPPGIYMKEAERPSEYQPKSELRQPVSPTVADSTGSRPSQPTRMPTLDELTPLDRTWGQLFDEDGAPTVRLSQFLRGLANHLIEDYEPLRSIVVTPRKMARYYEEMALQKERRSWDDIFRRKTNASLSRIYQDLGCQHHLIQTHNDEPPSVPALTPIGFERWMTVQILANPGEEFERILQTVEQMPISNADNQQERFPKKISRKLFPRSGDSKYHRQFERAIRDDDGVTSSGSLPTESSTSMRRESMVGSAHSAHSGSQRKREEPLSDEAMESSPLDHAALKRPIERERKPYAAIPGAGRIAEEDRKMDPLIGSMPVRTGRSGSMSQARAPPYLKSFGDAPSAENPVGSAYRFPPRAQSNASEVFPNAHGGMNNVLGGNDTERATNSYARTASVKGRRRSRSVSRNGYEAGYRRSGADLSASMNDMSSDDSHGGHRTSRRSRRGPDDNRRSYHREKCEDVKHNEQARARVYEVGGREREDDEYHGRSTGQYYRP